MRDGIHWNYDVDFEEFEFVWAPESLTRMALLLAKEVHISQIERTLQPDAEARGMRVISSTNEAAQTYTMFGGLYRENTEQWPDHFTPGLPLQNINIRQALNKAIDRDAINQEISGISWLQSVGTPAGAASSGTAAQPNDRSAGTTFQYQLAVGLLLLRLVNHRSARISRPSLTQGERPMVCGSRSSTSAVAAAVKP